MTSVNDFPKEKKNESYIYSYYYDLEFINPDNDDFSIHPLKIIGIEKNKDYMNNFTPKVMISLVVNKIDMFELKKNKKDVLLKINVKAKKYIKKDEKDGLDEIESSILSSSLFIPLFSPTAFDERYREDEYNNEENTSELGNPTNTLETNRINMIIGISDIVASKTAKTLFNTGLKSGQTIGSILLFISYSVPVKYVLIDKPDNQNTLPETIIPPGGFIQTMNYLQTTFGIYNNGLLVFYDNDILYILNKFNMDHDCKQDEKVITHLYIEESDVSGGMCIVQTNDSGESEYIGSISTRYIDNEVTDAELEGNNFVFSSFKQGLDAVSYKNDKVDSTTAKPVTMVLKRNVETHKHSGEKNILDYDELNNPFNMASSFNESEAVAKKVVAVLFNVNIKDFSANKIVHLHYKTIEKDNRLGGLYHILSCKEMYSPSKGIPTEEEAIDEEKNNNHANELQCMLTIVLSKRNS